MRHSAWWLVNVRVEALEDAFCGLVGGQDQLDAQSVEGGVERWAELGDDRDGAHDLVAEADVATQHPIHRVGWTAHVGPTPVDLAAAPGRTLVFTRTEHGAKRLTRQLNAVGVRSVEVHGNLGQNARDCNLRDFRTGTARPLVATHTADGACTWTT